MWIQVEVFSVVTPCSDVVGYQLTSSGWSKGRGSLDLWNVVIVLHGVTTQKTSTWNITAVETSKLATLDSQNPRVISCVCLPYRTREMLTRQWKYVQEAVKGKGKCKVVPALSFNWAPRHEGLLREWRYSSTDSLTSAVDGGVWSASRPGRFTFRERVPATHCIGGWVGPRDVLDIVVKRKIPSPRRDSKPRTPIAQPVAQRYTDWTNTALQEAVELG
jgi:hypothetical protein